MHATCPEWDSEHASHTVKGALHRPTHALTHHSPDHPLTPHADRRRLFTLYFPVKSTSGASAGRSKRQ